MMDAICLKEVRFSYPGSPQLLFNFNVMPAMRLAIMGPSGSGKSTLLHLLAGFEKAESGRICFGHTDMTDVEPAGRPVSILFQDNNLFGHLTVAQNTGLGLAPRLKLSNVETLMVETALAKVGLAGFGKRLASELSGGERQRAALARCLLRNKPVLLLDEPFAALGPAMRAEMLELVLELQIERALTVIMVTHNPDDAAHFASHLGFIENSGLTSILPISAIDHPQKGSALAAYLGSRQNNC